MPVIATTPAAPSSIKGADLSQVATGAPTSEGSACTCPIEAGEIDFPAQLRAALASAGLDGGESGRKSSIGELPPLADGSVCTVEQPGVQRDAVDGPSLGVSESLALPLLLALFLPPAPPPQQEGAATDESVTALPSHPARLPIGVEAPVLEVDRPKSAVSLLADEFPTPSAPDSFRERGVRDGSFPTGGEEDVRRRQQTVGLDDATLMSEARSTVSREMTEARQIAPSTVLIPQALATPGPSSTDNAHPGGDVLVALPLEPRPSTELGGKPGSQTDSSPTEESSVSVGAVHPSRSSSGSNVATAPESADQATPVDERAAERGGRADQVPLVPSTTEPTPEIVPREVVAQIARHPDVTRLSNGRTVRVQLQPEGLGGVEVTARYARSGGVELQLVAESHETAELVQQGWTDLRESLARQGVVADRMVVIVLPPPAVDASATSGRGFDQGQQAAAGGQGASHAGQQGGQQGQGRSQAPPASEMRPSARFVARGDLLPQTGRIDYRV